MGCVSCPPRVGTICRSASHDSPNIDCGAHYRCRADPRDHPRARAAARRPGQDAVAPSGTVAGAAGSAGEMPGPILNEFGEEIVATFSIVARDPATDELGVAVQSRAFRAGAIVSYAKAGVGAIATQAAANQTYGPRGLELLELGLSPDEVVEHLTGSDPGPRPPPARRDRRRGAGAGLHRIGHQRLGRAHRGRELLRAGQHPGRGGGGAGHGGGVRVVDRAARASADGRSRCGRGSRGRRARQAGRRRAGGEAHRRLGPDHRPLGGRACGRPRRAVQGAASPGEHVGLAHPLARRARAGRPRPV